MTGVPVISLRQLFLTNCFQSHREVDYYRERVEDAEDDGWETEFTSCLFLPDPLAVGNIVRQRRNNRHRRHGVDNLLSVKNRRIRSTSISSSRTTTKVRSTANTRAGYQPFYHTSQNTPKHNSEYCRTRICTTISLVTKTRPLQ